MCESLNDKTKFVVGFKYDSDARPDDIPAYNFLCGAAKRFEATYAGEPIHTQGTDIEFGFHTALRANSMFSLKNQEFVETAVYHKMRKSP